MYGLILCRSLTYAQRASRLLTRSGFHTNIQRVPPQTSSSGCGYTVSLPERELSEALSLLREHGFNPSGALLQQEDGSVRELSL